MPPRMIRPLTPADYPIEARWHHVHRRSDGSIIATCMEPGAAEEIARAMNIAGPPPPAIEPCISGRCFAPAACNAFGYCRERNFADRFTTEDIIRGRRKLFGPKL